MLLMKVFIVPSLVRFPASAQCRSVSAESSFGFRLFSSGLSMNSPPSNNVNYLMLNISHIQKLAGNS